MSRSNLPCWMVRVLAATLGLLAASPALGLVQHPNIVNFTDSEWAPGINLGPAAATVGRWNNNASAVAIGPNDAPVGYSTDYIITTRHQGYGMGSSVNFGGADYYVYDLFIHPTADLRIVRIRNAGGQPAALADWAGFYTGTDETTRTNHTAVIGGFGKSRGDTYTNYYTWAGSDNLTQRWGQNKLVDSVNNMSAGSLFGESYKSNVLRASFDNYGSGMRVPYESALAEFDSGGGWFLPVGDQWKLAGLSAYVQVGGGKSYFSGVNPPPNTGEMLSSVRISSYANWIDAVFKRSTWQSSTGGSWADPANWTAGVPSGKDKFAVFLDSLPGSRTVTVGAAAPFGTLRFDSPGNYTIDSAGAGKLECLVTIGAGAIEVYGTSGAGAHTLAAPIKLSSPLVINQDSTSALLTLAGPITTPTGLKTGLTKVGAGTLVLAGPNTFNNGLEVRKGTVRVTSAGALGNPAPDADIKGVALLAAGLDFRTDTDLTFVHDLRVAPLTGSSVTSTLNVDRLASGTGRTVTLGTLTTEGPVTLNVTGGNGYSLAFSGLASIDGLSSAGIATISTAGADLKLLGGLTLNQGTLAKTGSGTLTVAGTQTCGPNTILKVNQGTLDLKTDVGAVNPYALAVNVSGAGAAVNFGSSQHLAGLTIGDSGQAAVAAGGSRTLSTRMLSITGGAEPTGRLDLADNFLVVNYTGSSPLAQITDWVRSGFADLAWNGNGIWSSAAAADPGAYAIGFAEHSAIKPFLVTPFGPGNPFGTETDIDDTTVLVRYTRVGDLDLSGDVTLADFSLFVTGFSSGGTKTGWQWGDLDYSGAITLTDFALFVSGFNKQGSLLGGGGELDPLFNDMPGGEDLYALFNSLVGAGDGGLPQVGTVPEPATLGLMALGLAGVAVRRWRRARAPE